MDTPPWGTPPGTEEATREQTRSRGRQWLGYAAVVAVVVVACVALVAQDVRADEDNPVVDVAAGLVMLALIVAVVAAAGHGFRWLIVRGFAWWARLVSASLFVVSAWATPIANAYGDAHLRPDGTVTGLAELLLIPPISGIVAALVGIGMAWVWSFTPAGRAAMHQDGTEAPAPPSGWPAEDAQPPFTFRVPHHEAWHQLVLPISLILFAILGVISALVRDPGPVLLYGLVALLLFPFALLVIVPAYQKQLVVRSDGLYVARTFNTRLVRWQELNDIEIAPDPSSQTDDYRMCLITTTGRCATDVPKGPETTLNHWREAILAARPATDATLNRATAYQAEGRQQAIPLHSPHQDA